MSAYDILDRLRGSGLRSPLQIYRALGPLTEQGLVHRLESLSAFVACAHPHDPGCGKPPAWSPSRSATIAGRLTSSRTRR
jgi:Fe2+ or Zn2+ uptake regulation protein